MKLNDGREVHPKSSIVLVRAISQKILIDKGRPVQLVAVEECNPPDLFATGDLLIPDAGYLQQTTLMDEQNREVLSLNIAGIRLPIPRTVKEKP